MLVWITTPRVLLLRFIPPILMKISKGTDTEASNHYSVCRSYFNSFLRVLGVWIKKTERRKIMSIRNFVRVYRQVMMFSGIRFEFWDGYIDLSHTLNVPETKITLLFAHLYLEGATVPSDNNYWWLPATSSLPRKYNCIIIHTLCMQQLSVNRTAHQWNIISSSESWVSALMFLFYL